MGIVPRYSQEGLFRETQQELRNIERGIIRILKMVGEIFVSDARQNLNISSAFPKGDYTDRSSHLRGSIGYFVLHDGAVIAENLEGEPEGQAAAKATLATVPKRGFQLVGVAGMPYASYVESRGYNVITSQAGMALINTRDMLEKYRQRMAAKGKDVGFDMDNFITTLMR